MKKTFTFIALSVCILLMISGCAEMEDAPSSAISTADVQDTPEPPEETIRPVPQIDVEKTLLSFEDYTDIRIYCVNESFLKDGKNEKYSDIISSVDWSVYDVYTEAPALDPDASVFLERADGATLNIQLGGYDAIMVFNGLPEGVISVDGIQRSIFDRLSAWGSEQTEQA